MLVTLASHAEKLCLVIQSLPGRLTAPFYDNSSIPYLGAELGGELQSTSGSLALIQETGGLETANQSPVFRSRDLC